MAYSGVRLGASQTAEFTPVASYPGLTPEVRARLGEMKVAPASADTIADDGAASRPRPRPAARAAAPKSVPAKAKRAEAN